MSKFSQRILGHYFLYGIRAIKTLTSSIQKKNGYTIPTKISFTSQPSKFYAYKTHLYQLSLMGNTRTIPPHEDEITGSKGDGKIPKSDMAAWIRTEILVKAWIIATFDAFKTKLGFWVQPMSSLTGSNRAHKKLNWSYHFVTTRCICMCLTCFSNSLHLSYLISSLVYLVLVQ